MIRAAKLAMEEGERLQEEQRAKAAASAVYDAKLMALANAVLASRKEPWPGESRVYPSGWLHVDRTGAWQQGQPAGGVSVQYACYLHVVLNPAGSEHRVCLEFDRHYGKLQEGSVEAMMDFLLEDV